MFHYCFLERDVEGKMMLSQDPLLHAFNFLSTNSFNPHIPAVTQKRVQGLSQPAGCLQVILTSNPLKMIRISRYFGQEFVKM